MTFLFWKLSLKDQKLYYPMIATAFKNGTFDHERFAVIADKIAFADKGSQIYGTQLANDGALMLVENIDSLDYRRLRIGLLPVQKHIKCW